MQPIVDDDSNAVEYNRNAGKLTCRRFVEAPSAPNDVVKKGKEVLFSGR
jgi:hypothetical protein